MPRPDREAATVLYTHRSRPLAEIAQPLLKDSINLYGEALMRLNAARGALPTNDAALEGLRTRLASWGIAADAQQIVDGSGLSRRDVIAPEALLVVLAAHGDRRATSPLVTGLPIAGVDGSLAGRMKRHGRRRQRAGQDRHDVEHPLARRLRHARATASGWRS